MKHKSKHGFTLIELMVSMAVTIILVMFVNSIFSTAGRAIRQGVATSNLIGSTAIVTKQIDTDGREMIGPRSGGFLVILNKTAEDVRLTPSYASRNELGSKKKDLPDLRVDQVAWVRTRGNLEPMAPGGNKDDPTGSFSTASHVRIWYGHCLKTDEDGKTPDNDTLGVSAPNEIGINFVLGRHALFLEGQAAHRNTIYAETAAADSKVNGDLGAKSPAAKMYMGLTDVTAQSLNDIRSEFAKAASGGAKKQASIASQYAFGQERLHVNTSPNPELDYEIWQFSQMHPAFVNHVSEFEVSFAGDYDGQRGIDTESYAVTPLQEGDEEHTYQRIKWYDSENPPQNLDSNSIKTKYGEGWAFVPGQKNWPHMLRIRFRAHDVRGQLSGPDGLIGPVYEVIIKVNRD